MATPTSTRRERWAWYLYDFGNSAYASVVLLAVYSAYFQGQVVGGAEGSRLWGLAVGIAMLVVAVISPILGTLADFSGSKKRFLFLTTATACLFTAGLFLAEPGNVWVGMGFFILAEIGYRSAQVFYNGFLSEIAAPEEMGRVSGYGWAIGTAGGIVCLLLILPLVVVIKGTLIVRLAMVITAIFFAASATPLFLWLRERAEPQPLPAGKSYLSVGFKPLLDMLLAICVAFLPTTILPMRQWLEKLLGRTLPTYRFTEFLKFILAFLIYNDGVIMALDFAAIIGAVLFGMDQTTLIFFIIIVQVTNVGGAYVFGVLVDRFGGKRSLALSILVMIGAVLWLFFAQTQMDFFLIGAVAGFAMAGIQSVSRTMVAMFAPPGKGAEFYGFFAVAGRTSSFIGPAVYGWIAAETALWYQAQGQAVASAEQAGQRVATLSIAAFLLAGLILLWFVDEAKARAAATRSS